MITTLCSNFGNLQTIDLYTLDVWFIGLIEAEWRIYASVK